MSNASFPYPLFLYFLSRIATPVLAVNKSDILGANFDFLWFKFHFRSKNFSINNFVLQLSHQLLLKIGFYNPQKRSIDRPYILENFSIYL